MVEVPLSEATKSTNLKINTLFSLAAALVIVCLAVVIFMTDINEFAKGIITLILGRFLGYLDNIYNYETGTTRGSVKADETIKDLAKTTVPVSTLKNKPDAVV